MQFGLVVDSSCELTPELFAQFSAVQVPYVLRVNEVDYVDDDTLQLPVFLKALSESREKQQSACPSVQQYCDAFLAQQAPQVFCITISSRLSGSYNSATLGAELAREQGKQVHVFDSLSATAGQLRVAFLIQDCVNRGMTFAQIIDYVTPRIPKMQTLFILGNTEALVRNGRMSAVLGKAVTMLDIKLILGADGDGNIKQFGKARGYAKALAKLAEFAANTSMDEQHRAIVVTHCNNEAAATQLAALAKAADDADISAICQTKGLSSLYAGDGGVVLAV